MAACISDLKKGDDKSAIYDLIDRVLLKAGTIPSDTFLITASTKAGIDRILDLYKSPGGNSDDCFPPYIGDYIQEKLSLSGGSLHVSAACASSTVALAKGAALIESGRCDSVLVCCFDLVTEFVFSGFCSVQAMTPSFCMPFDKNRKGMSIGEGAATLLLMAPEKAKELNKKPRGVLSGWGITNDATHITRPDKDGCGLSLAIERSLDKAEISADSVSAICAHGTGTYHNDSMELASYKKVFGDVNVPIFSVKGAIGHTLGAAGGIEAALSLECLLHGLILPTIGFSMPEKGAEDLVSSEPVKKNISYILSTNSGFAGVNGAVVLGRGVES
ncbi:beta-ketoacyl synthase N-terminal-like domain-containing protein [Thermodesulfobacteriota bacterium]